MRKDQRIETIQSTPYIIWCISNIRLMLMMRSCYTDYWQEEDDEEEEAELEWFETFGEREWLFSVNNPIINGFKSTH